MSQYSPSKDFQSKSKSIYSDACQNEAELNQILKGDVLYFYKILTKKMFPFYKKLKIKEMTDLFEIFITKNYIKAIEYSYEYFMNKFNLEIKKILDENQENSKDKEGNQSQQEKQQEGEEGQEGQETPGDFAKEKYLSKFVYIILCLLL